MGLSVQDTAPPLVTPDSPKLPLLFGLGKKSAPLLVRHRYTSCRDGGWAALNSILGSFFKCRLRTVGFANGAILPPALPPNITKPTAHRLLSLVKNQRHFLCRISLPI